MPLCATSLLSSGLLSALQSVQLDILSALVLIPLLTLAVSLCWPLPGLLLPRSPLLRVLCMTALLASVFWALPGLARHLGTGGQWLLQAVG